MKRFHAKTLNYCDLVAKDVLVDMRLHVMIVITDLPREVVRIISYPPRITADPRSSTLIGG